MATMLSQELVQVQEANDTVIDFMRRFEVGKLLRVCRASKSKGFSVVELFRYLLCCMFSQTSTYFLLSVEANLIQKENGKIASRIPARIVFIAALMAVSIWKVLEGNKNEGAYQSLCFDPCI